MEGGGEGEMRRTGGPLRERGAVGGGNKGGGLEGGLGMKAKQIKNEKKRKIYHENHRVKEKGPHRAHPGPDAQETVLMWRRSGTTSSKSRSTHA